MKIKELREKKQDELRALEGTLRQELGRIRLQLNLGQWKKTDQISALRRDIARIMTLVKEKSK